MSPAVSGLGRAAKKAAAMMTAEASKVMVGRKGDEAILMLII
jgi:hypothetical protein